MIGEYIIQTGCILDPENPEIREPDSENPESPEIREPYHENPENPEKACFLEAKP